MLTTQNKEQIAAWINSLPDGALVASLTVSPALFGRPRLLFGDSCAFVALCRYVSEQDATLIHLVGDERDAAMAQLNIAPSQRNTQGQIWRKVTPPFTRAEIDEFCKAHDVSFFQWGDPDDWSRRDVFRVGTFDFPVRGITVSVDEVKKWRSPAMFAGEGI